MLKKTLKWTAAGAIAVMTAVSLSGCKGQEEPAKQEEPSTQQQKEVIVFAAASLTETLNEIEKCYQELEPDVKLVMNFDSSGTLKTQIQEGAECDVFISAGQKQMDQLEEEKGVDGKAVLAEGTRKNLLENKVVLAESETSKDNPAGFDEMAERLRTGSMLLAIGNEDVPVGQYSEKILNYYDLDAKQLSEQGAISYGSNVKEITTQIAEGSVSCGIIYATDAYSAGLQVLDTADAEMCGQVIYPAAVINNGNYPEEGKRFLDYLTGEEAGKIFESVGFTTIK